jgi:hypothetical protein
VPDDKHEVPTIMQMIPVKLMPNTGLFGLKIEYPICQAFSFSVLK